MTKIKLTALFCAALISSMHTIAEPAKAVESVSVVGPIGGSDVSAGFLPPPGLYITGVTGNVKTIDYYNNDGIQSPASGHHQVGAISLLYSYPGKFMGGQLASSISFSSDIKGCFTFPGAPEGCGEGFDDIYTDVLMWSRYYPDKNIATYKGAGRIPYGLSILAGLGVLIPVGEYGSEFPFNTAANTWVASPNIGMTYTAPSIFPAAMGEAMEFSARGFYHIYEKNKETNYQTGDVVSMDFAATIRKGAWRYGIAGLAYKQLEDDKINGITHPNDGNRAEAFVIGPILSRDFMAGDRPMNFTIKGLRAVNAKNQPQANIIFARITAKF